MTNKDNRAKDAADLRQKAEALARQRADQVIAVENHRLLLSKCHCKFRYWVFHKSHRTPCFPLNSNDQHVKNILILPENVQWEKMIFVFYKKKSD